MGWTDWFKDGSGECKEKAEKNSDGSTSTHYLRSDHGNRNDHSHIVVNKNADGKTTSAHGAPRKSKR